MDPILPRPRTQTEAPSGSKNPTGGSPRMRPERLVLHAEGTPPSSMKVGRSIPLQLRVEGSFDPNWVL
jgi:hypothetical protein